MGQLVVLSRPPAPISKKGCNWADFPKNIRRDGKQRFVNLCICVPAKEITAWANRSKKTWLQGWEFQSVLKKQNRSTQYFVPGLRHASFALKCGHVRMLKNAMRVHLSHQMEKSANQHARSPHFGTARTPKCDSCACASRPRGTSKWPRRLQWMMLKERPTCSCGLGGGSF